MKSVNILKRNTPLEYVQDDKTDILSLWLGFFPQKVE